MLYTLFLEYLILPVGDLLLGTRFIKELRNWRRLLRATESELEKLQEEKLERLLMHAVKNIPAYKHLNNKSNLCIQDFPILRKKEIKENENAYLWHPDSKEKLIIEKSSGSSGIQGRVFMSKREQSKVTALQTHLWEWSGYRIGKPLLQTGITPTRSTIKRIKDILLRVEYQAAFGLDPKFMLTALQKFKGKKQAFFGGYASSLFLYAKTAEENQLKDVKFTGAISWGDKLFPHYRSTIEKNLGCKSFDIYGATEGFVISGQKDLDYHYIVTPQVYVELLDADGNEVKDGELGYVVVTHLDAYEMPLIRYYLGDLAVKLPREKYPKKKDLALPLFERIIGRDTDVIVTPKGKYMVVHSFTGIFEHLPEIKQFRVIQSQKESITIEYIPETTFTPELLQVIKERILSELNETIDISFKEVEVIPDSASGKPQLIVSSVKI